MELTEGTLYLSHTPSANNLSRISHAKIPGSLIFRSLMKLTTLGVVTRGFEPPIAPARVSVVDYVLTWRLNRSIILYFDVPGRMDPVSLYLARIFETHP